MKAFHRMLLGAIAALSLTTLARAESCDTDCHGQCRVRTDFPPIEFIEPVCHAKCEAAKQAACRIGQPLPTIPLTPREQFEQTGNLACGSVYHGITQAVIAQCSNFDARLDGQDQIAAAANLLIRSGLFSSDEFNGIQIRFCPHFRGEGMAPEANRIYLHTSMMNSPVVSLASLLGHEMVHIRQHRSMGAERFACSYSRALTACGGCQDDNNPMEREAFQWQRDNDGRIAVAASTPPLGPPSSAPPQPSGVSTGFVARPAAMCMVGPMQGCPMGIMLPAGAPCTCAGPMGVFQGISQ